MLLWMMGVGFENIAQFQGSETSTLGQLIFHLLVLCLV